jgi:hypothetical protein
MKIAYLLDDDISQRTGIVKKIESKIRLWERFGHEAKVFSLRSGSLESIINNGVIISQFGQKNTLVQKFYQQYKNSKILDEYLSEFRPDVIYARQMKYYPRMVKVLKKHAKYIVEINSNDIEELKLNSKVVYIYNRLTRNHLLKNASGLMSVSNELISDNIFSKFNKLSIVIGNGYDFENVKVKKSVFNESLEFVFIGTPGQAWHGVDKVLYLATKLKKYTFHIVGPSLDEIHQLGQQISDNVVIHGYFDQHRLEGFVAKCDIGISTLALHRKNMEEASPLKSRQYLAQGLPIIIGYKDTDLPSDLGFVLNIGNYEDNVQDNIEKIEEFIDSLAAIDLRQVIEKSKVYLDYKEKENKRLKFFEKVLNV